MSEVDSGMICESEGGRDGDELQEVNRMDQLWVLLLLTIQLMKV